MSREGLDDCCYLLAGRSSSAYTPAVHGENASVYGHNNYCSFAKFQVNTTILSYIHILYTIDTMNIYSIRKIHCSVGGFIELQTLVQSFSEPFLSPTWAIYRSIVWFVVLCATNCIYGV